MTSERKRRRIFGPLTFGTLIVCGLVYLGTLLYPWCYRQYECWRIYRELVRSSDRDRDQPAMALLKEGATGQSYLFEALESPDMDVREAASRYAFDRVDNPRRRAPALIKALQGADAAVALNALFAVPTFAHALDQRSDAKMRAKLRAAVVSAMHKFPDAQSIHLAIYDLTTMGKEAKQALPELEKQAQCPDEAQRFWAAVACAAIDPNYPKAKQALVRALADTPDSSVSLVSRFIPSKRSDSALEKQSFLELLGELLSNDSPKVRRNSLALLSWTEQRPKANTQALEHALDDRDPEVRCRAAILLSAYPAPGTTELTLRVRKTLVDAILDPAQPLNLRYQAVSILHARRLDSDEPLVAPLIDQLESEDARTRRSALVLLKELEVDALTALQPLARLYKTDTLNRPAIYEFLNKFDPKLAAKLKLESEREDLENEAEPMKLDTP